MSDDESVFAPNGKSLGSYTDATQLKITQPADVTNIGLFADATSSIHLDIPLHFYYKAGATAPRQQEIESAINRALQNAVNRDGVKPCYTSSISHVGDVIPGKPIPTWADGKTNPCMTVIIEPTDDAQYWPQNRLRFLAIDWENIKCSFNFNNVFKLPRIPKAEWDAGAESHWLAYMAIPTDLWIVDTANLIGHFIEQADLWCATPYAETRGRQTSVFFKFDTEADLIETLKSEILVTTINNIEIPPTSSHVDYVRVLVLGHIANIPDLAGKYTEWWLKQAKAYIPVCLFLARCGVKEADLPQVVTPIVPLSGPVDMCFLTFKTATAAANCYEKLGWDSRGVTVLANGLGRAALFTYPVLPTLISFMYNMCLSLAISCALCVLQLTALRLGSVTLRVTSTIAAQLRSSTMPTPRPTYRPRRPLASPSVTRALLRLLLAPRPLPLSRRRLSARPRPRLTRWTTELIVATQNVCVFTGGALIMLGAFDAAAVLNTIDIHSLAELHTHKQDSETLRPLVGLIAFIAVLLAITAIMLTSSMLTAALCVATVVFRQPGRASSSSALLLVGVILVLAPGVTAWGDNVRQVLKTNALDTSDILFISINVNGGLLNKLSELNAYITRRNPDFLIVCETNTAPPPGRDENAWHSGFVPRYLGYHIYPGAKGCPVSEDFRERKGVSVWMREEWKEHTRIEPIWHLNMFHVRIGPGDAPIHLLATYAEPQNKVKYWRNYQQWLREQNFTQRSKVILMGDLNAVRDPELDRNRCHDKFSSNDPKEFRDISERAPLFLSDVWRLRHAQSRRYTWMQSHASNSPMARIDLVLASKSLDGLDTLCEILSAETPLTKDHLPIAFAIKRPASLRKVPDRGIKLPEIEIPKLNVRGLKDIEKVTRYQKLTRKLLAQSLATCTQTPTTIEYYEILVECARQAAQDTVGHRNIIINKIRPARAKTLYERNYNLCQTVLLSMNHILADMRADKDGRMPVTKKMAKIHLYAPPEYAVPDPNNITNEAQATEWFDAVRYARGFLAKQVHDARHDERLEQILDAIERISVAEESAPRQWYQRANIYTKRSKNTKQQSAVMNELDPDPAKRKDIIHSDPKEVNKAIGQFWAQLFEKHIVDRTGLDKLPQEWFSKKFYDRRTRVPERSRTLMNPITREEMRLALSSLKNEKANGTDGVPGELLKHLDEESITDLLNIYNHVLASGQVPAKWRHTKIYCIFKGGDPTKCSNYRPISLLCVPYKLLMWILTQRLMALSEDIPLLHNTQGGFRSGRSCMDKITYIVNMIERHRTEGLATHIAFIDLKKAYDSVPFDALFEVLRQHKIDARFIDLLKALYADGTASVITAYGDTNPFPIRRGLRQGDPASPILFNLFLEPLLEWVLDTMQSEDDAEAAYADDIMLASPHIANLQRMINQADDYFYYYGMEMGIDHSNKVKTAHMTSQPSAGDIHVSKINRKTLDNGAVLLTRSQGADELITLPKLVKKETYKYLGVHVNVKLNWRRHMKHMDARLLAHLHHLRYAHFTHRQVVKIINVVVIPSITYGFECMPNYDNEMLEWAKEWDKLINRVVNTKSGLPRFAEATLHYLPTDEMGSGLTSICDRVARLQFTGKMKYGWNSNDTDTAASCKRKWDADNTIKMDENGDKYLAWKDDARIRISENRARQHISMAALERIFPLEGTREILKSRGVSSLDDIIKRDGTLVDEYVSPLSRHVCIEGTSLVHPLILYSIDHPQAIKGQTHKKLTCIEGKMSVCAWTDGSSLDNEGEQTGYALCFGEHNQFAHRARLPQGTRVFIAELYAAITAVLLHDPNVDLHVFLDCKAAWDVLRDPRRFLRKRPMEGELLHALIDAVDHRNKLGKATHFYHIYSHLLDTSEHQLNDELKVRLRRMRDRWGSDADQILRMNQKADVMAKAAAVMDVPVIETDTQRMPAFLARRLVAHKKNGEVICKSRTLQLSEVPKLLKDMQLRKHRKKLDANADGKYAWLKSEEVNWPFSALLGIDKKRSLVSLQKHAIKHQRNMIADKETRLSRQREPGWTTYWGRVYGGIKVQDTICESCRPLDPELPQRETRHHYLYCAAHAEVRRKITKTIRAKIVQSAISLPSEVKRRRPGDDPGGGHEDGDGLPGYWNEDEKTPRFLRRPSDYRTKIEDFPVTMAACGLVPQAWVEYLDLHFKWKPDITVKHIVSFAQQTIMEGYRESWRRRNRDFFKNHTDRDVPPLPKRRKAKRRTIRDEPESDGGG